MTGPTRRMVLIASTGTLATVVGIGTWRLLFADGFEELPPSAVFATNGVAIRGTDPVAYFREGRAVKGSPDFSTRWSGVEWHFASAANRNAFRSNPDRYAPQYGGFCAWAVAAKGKLYSTQPKNWSIVDGRLYLNFNDDIQARWEKDIPGFIAKADARWPQILKAL